MEILEAKNLVIEAGKKLVKTGLIARTWGNVSCRVSPTQFVITPSGRAYETLTPDEIVLVNIADCSYEGNIKPSSEKGIHASVYEMRPEMDFVIHTHQPYASAAAAISPNGAAASPVFGASFPLPLPAPPLWEPLSEPLPCCPPLPSLPSPVSPV